MLRVQEIMYFTFPGEEKGILQNECDKRPAWICYGDITQLIIKTPDRLHTCFSDRGRGRNKCHIARQVRNGARTPADLDTSAGGTTVKSG